MIQKFITLWRLGFHNLIWAATYRLALKLGFVTRNMRIGSNIKGPFFVPLDIDADKSLESLDLQAFGWIEFSKQHPPVWDRSITTGKQADVQSLHWSKISDFDLDIGDIKAVWELSRFDWLFYFVIEYLKTGDKSKITSLNEWLENWSENNPINQGVNWKCGQEASIRVMHLCLASFLLQQHKLLSEPLVDMLEQHLSRISPTVLYAMAQDNNHGTSEAVALYIGGIFLEFNGRPKYAGKWKKKGRFWIENRVKRLVEQDGSFSQYSVNYHRLMLDSLCLAEFFRQQFAEPMFADQTLDKLRLATSWLNIFTDELSGDAPNLGANDGAKLMPLSNADYRDYRPSVQLASTLFYKKIAYKGKGSFNQPLKLLFLSDNYSLLSSDTEYHFNKGGYAYIKKGPAHCYVRYPRFKFRPGQCDALHVDFWLQGRNILRDAGSFSYNTDKQWLNYFPGTQAHNTVQFDGAEQMPRISRFLYGSWLTTRYCSGFTHSDEMTEFKLGYQSPEGFKHNRKIALSDRALLISDEVDGFNRQAVMRWRLLPGNYEIQDKLVIGNNFKLEVSADVEIVRFELVEGWESRYYLRKTALPVLEIEVLRPATISTKINWKLN